MPPSLRARTGLPFQAILPAGVLALSLVTGACASVPQNAAPEPAATPEPVPAESPQGPSLPVYSQDLRIPLWEKPPPGLDPERIPALSVSLSLVDSPSPGGAVGEAAGALGRLLRDTLYRGLSPQAYAEDLVRVQTVEYRDMGEEARNNPRIALSETLNWSYEERFEQESLSPRLLQIARNRASYTGGAHGNYDKKYFVFERDLGMRISLSDLVREDALPDLRRLVNRELRAGKKLGPADSLKKALFFVDEADLTENYFLSPQGLGFHWDPYEIAPYAEGHVEVLVPYGDVAALVRPEGQRLIRELENP